jgi:hypothetical protein
VTVSLPARPPAPLAANRVVHRGDGVEWLRTHPLPADHAIVTSLPDASEVKNASGWREWFVATAELACRQVADEAVAMFFQTDVKRDGRWVDKAYLIQRGAEAAGSHLLWHKVVCRVAPGTITMGRPAYAHLLCFSRALRLAPGRSTPDVLPALGEMTWVRAMGTAACAAAAEFLLAETACRTVVDPFCGIGTMLAIANTHGLAAIGVEISRRRAAKAARFVLSAGT